MDAETLKLLLAHYGIKPVGCHNSKELLRTYNLSMKERIKSNASKNRMRNRLRAKIIARKLK